MDWTNMFAFKLLILVIIMWLFYFNLEIIYLQVTYSINLDFVGLKRWSGYF